MRGITTANLFSCQRVQGSDINKTRHEMPESGVKLSPVLLLAFLLPSCDCVDSSYDMYTDRDHDPSCEQEPCSTSVC